MLRTLGLLLADVPLSPNAPMHDYQMELLYTFFENIPDHFHETLTKNGQLRHVCDWVRIKNESKAEHFSQKCENRILHELQITHLKATYRLDFLPPTLRVLKLNWCGCKGRIHTARIPRDIRIFEVGCNKLKGTIDLQSLPAKITECKAIMNKLSGCIRFVHLPSSLRVLSLMYNRITQHTVYFDKLPPQMQMLSVHGNRIRSVKPLLPESDVEKARKVIQGVKVKSR